MLYDTAFFNIQKSELPKKFAFKFMAPQVGLEPTTLRLTAACSTD